MLKQTRIALCDVSSITFSEDGEPTVADNQTLRALQSASHLLQDKEVVAFPTETVYGLGALALDPAASSRIFSTKGRPPDNPLIVHVSSEKMLLDLLPTTYTIPPVYTVLMRYFWPGPLTLLFPADPVLVPSIITAGQPTVAVRMPSHPVARALISLANAPIAAPSANSSGKPSPTQAEHVFRDLQGKLDLILDGGACDVGLESTVVDGLHEDGMLRVLRPGGVTVEEIEKVLQTATLPEGVNVPQVLVHKRDYRDEALESAPTTPGMKYRHYSPAVPVILACTSSSPPGGTGRTSWSSFVDSLRDRASNASSTVKVGLLAPSDSLLGQSLSISTRLTWRFHPLGSINEPAVTAKRLFDGLLTLEKDGVDLIVIEEVKEEHEGLAIMNRVKKAASEVVWIGDMTPLAAQD